ncbi:MAG: alanine dehydrogenase [candidate division Zixibacteria bacterium]|nr:alanine dehydrogenase [candidate division Zixibacteria bacterium]
MDIGIAKESEQLENRVALTPACARALTNAGHTVYLEQGAGEISGFTDQDYLAGGAKIVYSREEVFLRSKLMLKVRPPSTDEYNTMPEGQIVLSSFHLAVAPIEHIKMLMEKKITAIGFEVIEDDMGNLPVLVSISELAGQMSINIASYHLSNKAGGRGILLGGAAGIPPATVVVLGAGTLGMSAVRAARGMGCNIILFDKDINKLRYASELYQNQITTYLPFEQNIEKAVKAADVLIGAVLVRGEQPPKLVSEEMVKSMKPKSVIIDASIDQGGCIETSRPTNWANPTYLKHNVTHFCVPNMTSNISRTATYALSNALLPYVLQIADNGLEATVRGDMGFACGIYTYHGEPAKKVITSRLGINLKSLKDILETGKEK